MTSLYPPGAPDSTSPPPPMAATAPSYAPHAPPAQPAPSTAKPLLGIAAGVAVMIIGAGVWAGIADATLHRLIFIGLATGVVMGLVFRRFGLKGPLYAILAALLTVAGCALGDAVGGTLIVAADVNVGAGTVLQHVPILTLMNVDALDGVFYALSAFVAFIRVLR